MPEQMIKIDVPEGCKISVSQTNYADFIQVNIYLEEKEPQYIEVREYLMKDGGGRIYHNSTTRDWGNAPADVERSKFFVRWLDQDWRKVEI